MSLRKTVRLVATGAFVLMLVPVVGDFWSEFARENGLYNEPTERLRAVLTGAQSVFGEQGFFWLLFFLGGLVTGLWFDVVLRQREATRKAIDPKLAAHIGYLCGIMPKRRNAWPRLTPDGSDWPSEFFSLQMLMIDAGFEGAHFDINADRIETLEQHRDFVAGLLPFVRNGQAEDLTLAIAWGAGRLNGKYEMGLKPKYTRPSYFMRLLGAKPKLRWLPDTGPETQP